MSAPVLAVLAVLAIAALVVLWKVVTTAAVIAGVQWLVVEHVQDVTVQVIVFGLPALLAAFLLTRLVSRSTESHGARSGRIREGVAR